MKINRTRPVVAFILVAVVCGFVIAQGLRASALNVVVSGRAPSSFAVGSMPGAVLGPVLSLLEHSGVIRPVLTARSESSTATRPVSRSTSTGTAQQREVVGSTAAAAAAAPVGGPAARPAPVADLPAETVPVAKLASSQKSTKTTAPQASAKSGSQTRHDRTATTRASVDHASATRSTGHGHGGGKHARTQVQQPVVAGTQQGNAKHQSTEKHQGNGKHGR